MLLPAWTTRLAIDAAQEVDLRQAAVASEDVGVAAVAREHDGGVREVAEAVDAARGAVRPVVSTTATRPMARSTTTPRSPVPRRAGAAQAESKTAARMESRDFISASLRENLR
jgi:hypothetical protein